MTTGSTAGRGIVCLSTNHWSGLPTGKQHLMLVVAETRRVLYVDPPIDLLSVLGRRRRWPELRGLRRVGDRLHVLSSVALLGGSDPSRRERFYERSCRRIRSAQTRVGLGRPAVWAFGPEHVACRGRLGESLFVYQASDEPASMSGRPEVTSALEERLLDVADVVFVVSEALLRSKAREGRVYRLPNAADRRHYARVLTGDPGATIDAFIAALDGPLREPRTIDGLSRPLVLYGGAAYDWFDVSLFLELAGLRPDWTFLLVGPVGRRVRSARLPSNVVSVGRVGYDEFARYVAACDAAIIPWKSGPFSENADPIVLYEYLLCGKSVVASDFPAARERGDLVRIARTADEFARALDDGLDERPGCADSLARVSFGFANTWEDRAARALEIIDTRAAGQEVEK